MASLKLIFLCGIISLTIVFVSSQNINYFGVAFSPYVKNAPFPYWDSYTLEEIKQMLRIVVADNRHNSISTYGMGVASYNNGKNWDKCDSNCLIARAAAQVNRDYKSVVLTVSQGIFQQDDPSLMTREINNAFSAAADANSIFPNTVWGLNFANEYVRDAQNGAKVLKWIKDNKSRAKKMGLKIGTRIDTCDQIYGGQVQNVLIQIAKESDFIMCNLYPPQGANNIDQAIQLISNAYYSSRDGFWRHNNKLEVMIGETGWASQGDTFNGAVNTVDNEKRFWEGMRNWAQSNKVKVQMFEAFNEPWKNGREGEKHFGWWSRPDNNQAKYVEKATGKVYQ